MQPQLFVSPEAPPGAMVSLLKRLNSICVPLSPAKPRSDSRSRVIGEPFWEPMPRLQAPLPPRAPRGGGSRRIRISGLSESGFKPPPKTINPSNTWKLSHHQKTTAFRPPRSTPTSHLLLHKHLDEHEAALRRRPIGCFSRCLHAERRGPAHRLGVILEVSWGNAASERGRYASRFSAGPKHARRTNIRGGDGHDQPTLGSRCEDRFTVPLLLPAETDRMVSQCGTLQTQTVKKS